MGEAALEGESVDERLEGGAGRAQGVDHVDGARALRCHVARAADGGENVAGRVVDDENSRRKPRIEAFDALAREGLEARLVAGHRG